jgi:pyrroloquinoline quinone biosynthesis protein E
VAHRERLQRPLGLIAELTHRCPLACAYCSNPVALERHEDEIDLATWVRIFAEAAALGVPQVHLSGGEPGARRDLVEIAASAREAGLYTRLITAGAGISTRTMRDLWEAGLHEVQVSFQDADAVSGDHIAGRKGTFQRKHAVAAEVVRLGLTLTISMVVHRGNVARIGEMVNVALALNASRIEFVPLQDRGWARSNRAALAPSAAEMQAAEMQVEALRRIHDARIAIEVAAACCSENSGPSWLHVTPSGRVLPCHGVESLADAEAWNVRAHSLHEIWSSLRAVPTQHSDMLLVRVDNEPFDVAGAVYQYRRQADAVSVVR